MLTLVLLSLLAQLLSLLGLCLVGALGDAVDLRVSSTTTATAAVGIVDSGQEKHDDGSYHFFYQGEDGSHREETAVVHNAGTKAEFLEVSGSYSYFDGDGKEVEVHYKADDHGFVPEGNNILPQISEAAKLTSEQQQPAESVLVTDYIKPPNYK